MRLACGHEPHLRVVDVLVCVPWSERTAQRRLALWYRAGVPGLTRVREGRARGGLVWAFCPCVLARALRGELPTARECLDALVRGDELPTPAQRAA